jgi:hypothetical protein
VKNTLRCLGVNVLPEVILLDEFQITVHHLIEFNEDY